MKGKIDAICFFVLRRFVPKMMVFHYRMHPKMG